MLLRTDFHHPAAAVYHRQVGKRAFVCGSTYTYGSRFTPKDFGIIAAEQSVPRRALAQTNLARARRSDGDAFLSAHLCTGFIRSR